MDHLASTPDLNDPQLVSAFDELSLWSAPFGLKLLDTVIYRAGINVLDIGFGTGFPLLELAMRFGDTSTIYGIDPWRAAAERAGQKIRTYGIKNVVLIEGVAEDIPLAAESIDLIVSNNGINNVSDLEQVLSECFRTAKHGAQFVFTMNLDTTMIEFYDVMEEVLRRRRMTDEIGKMKDHIYEKRKPLNEVTGSLERHGFEITRTVEDRFEYKFSNGTAMFDYYFIRLAFLDSWRRIVPPACQQEIFSEIENRLNTQSDQNGFLRLSVPYAVIDGRKP